MFDESFPNAESIFHQAFAAVDPAPRLLQILNEHPTYAAARDLIMFYFDAVAKDPSRAQPLASALITIARSPDAPTYEWETLYVVFAKELARTHFKYYNEDDMLHKAYGPTNEYLLDCLLSGLSLKLGLTVTTEMFSTIVDGLKAPRWRRRCSEVMVVGSCIQLLLSGPAITTKHAGPYRKSPRKIADRLKAQKKRGIVKDPHAIQVLDVGGFHSVISQNLALISHTAVARNFAC